MKALVTDIRNHLRQPWLLSILFIAIIPIFPEYISIPLAGASLWAAARDAKQRRSTLAVGTLGKLLLVFMLYMALGVFYSANPFNSVSTLSMWVIMFLIYVSMTTVLCNKQRLDTALFSISLVAGIVGLISCFQYGLNLVFGGVPQQFWAWIDKVLYQWFPMPLNLSDFGMRVSTTFNNPNIAAEYFIMVLPLVIYYAFSGRRSRIRILCRCCLLAGPRRYRLLLLAGQLSGPAVHRRRSVHRQLPQAAAHRYERGLPAGAGAGIHYGTLFLHRQQRRLYQPAVANLGRFHRGHSRAADFRPRARHTEQLGYADGRRRERAAYP